jgi:type IV secretory pathway TraG/TraD family ATPase VirD4
MGDTQPHHLAALFSTLNGRFQSDHPTYGHERADAWVGMIGTKIITQINAGRGAEEASQLIGDHEVERVEQSETVVAASATTTTRRDIRRVITAAEIATRLGPKDDGIRVLVLARARTRSS